MVPVLKCATLAGNRLFPLMANRAISFYPSARSAGMDKQRVVRTCWSMLPKAFNDG